MNRCRNWIVLGLLAALAGCDVTGLAIDGKGAAPQLELDEVHIGRDALTSDLSLMSKESQIRLGQKLNTALVGGFRRPQKGVSLKELPPGVSNEFLGLGWETPERTVSLVGKEDDIVLALDMVNKATKAEVDQIVNRYRLFNGAPHSQVSGSSAEYWFWQDGPVRLMFCAVKLGEGQYRMTSVLGLADVMDRLRMDEGSAQRDMAAAAQISNEADSK